MFLSDISVRRSVMTTMAVLVFVVLGIFSYRRLAVDLLPEVEFPYVTVSTIYPGAGPEEIESQVTKKIEDAVSTISRVKRIDSTSRENLSLVVIEFELGVDVDLASIDVKDEVDAILVDLPDDVEPPVIRKFDINAMPIMELAVSSDRPLEEVYRIADDVIRDRIARVAGVAEVEIVGGKEREIQVALDRARLKAYGLSAMDVVNGVAGENLTVPVGHITEERREYTLRALGEYPDLEGLKDLRIGMDGGADISLSSLGEVRDDFKEPRESARFEGESAVGLIVKKRGDANTVGTARGIKEALGEIERVLPSDVRIDIAQDRSGYIEDSIRDVLTNIFVGIFLTAFLLYLFLHDLRATLIAALAMPTSIVATFLLIDFAGFTINIMTLLALGISIGILVTNAIVVLENIVRFRQQGEDPESAARKGTDEIAVAVTSSTLTNIVVFTPIAFMSGIVGQFFKQFGLTVVFATLFSLLVSFTLTPLLASRILRGRGRGTGEERGGGVTRGIFAAWDRFYAGIEASYRSGLEWSLDHRLRVVGLSVLALGLALFLFRYLGGEFSPRGAPGRISLRGDLPPGAPPRSGILMVT